ncbi:hypothetical protein [Mycolicibacterium helvum]|uniref:PNPLA domain-containing protein n=1 Tax=Mycolicibacterium helvum TaxID=1534349 RepID=A0A7I7T0D5_9MYCO|nr:hypothetical protein [Mycolicibacterium helvum]BBY62360.1 hypothetical protein MHEL_06030 [Mycolicibacterium helvum]
MLFVFYVGWGVVEVVDSTLSLMHLAGGTSAGASTITSPFSLGSRGAASDAINQWNQWSDRYSLPALGSGPNTGLALGFVLSIYVFADIALIAAPLVVVAFHINDSATRRLRDFKAKMKGKKAGGDEAASKEVDVALSRVSGVDGLLTMAKFTAVGFLIFVILQDLAFLASGITQQGWLIWLTGVLSLLKWLMLGSVVIGLGVGLIGSREMLHDTVEELQTARKKRNTWAYVLALRIQIGIGALLLVFGGLRGDLGRQFDDAFLFPFGDGGGIGWRTAGIAAVLVAVMLVTANLCMRAYLPRSDVLPSGPLNENVHEPVEPKGQARTKSIGSIILGVVLVGIGVAALKFSWPIGVVFLGPGIIYLLIGVYSQFTLVETKPDIINTDADSNRKIGLPYSIAVAVIPLVVLTALAVRNGVRLLTVHQYGYGGLLILGFPIGAIVVGAGVVAATFAVLHASGRINGAHADADRRDGRPGRWTAAAVGSLAIPLFLAMGLYPQVGGHILGPWGAILALCIALAFVGAALVMLSDQVRTWGLLAAIGFRRTPFIFGILLCLIINSAIDDKYVYHDTRLGERLAASSDRASNGPLSQISLTAALDQWAVVQRSKNPGRTEIPLVFVASAGGGIRAAYWTALVMRCLTQAANNPCRQDQALPLESIFLASGISGGSLGLAGLHAAPNATAWVDSLKADFLGPTVAAMTFRDLANALLRINIHDSDRAAVLERAWEEAAAEQGGHLDRGLMQTAKNPDGTIAFPLLVLNGTSVTDGCRVTATALDLSTVSPPEDLNGSSATDCLALNQQRFRRGEALPALPATKDVFDNTCRGKGDRDPSDIRLSTAALLSARFPYVSPTGGLYSCNGDDRTFDLDGGLIDSSGALPLALLWPEIAQWINDEDKKDDSVCFAPKLIIMENGYLDQTRSQPSTHPSEWAAPLEGAMATQGAAASTARQAAAYAFEKSFRGHTCTGDAQSASDWVVPNVVDLYPIAQPGIQAPLGWTLAFYSRESLEGEVHSELNLCSMDIVAAWSSGSKAQPGSCKKKDGADPATS